MKKLLLSSPAFGLLSISGNAQMRHWAAQKYAGQHDRTSYLCQRAKATPSSSPSSMNPYTDIAYLMKNDNMLFYVMGRDVYSAGGSYAATLPEAIGSPAVIA